MHPWDLGVQYLTRLGRHTSLFGNAVHSHGSKDSNWKSGMRMMTAQNASAIRICLVSETSNNRHRARIKRGIETNSRMASGEKATVSAAAKSDNLPEVCAASMRMGELAHPSLGSIATGR